MVTPDFSGYATKAGLKCSDGRTITSKAFEHQDGEWVPLVWQHGHSDPENILGKVKLEHREDGTYGYAYFNDSPKALAAKAGVAHGDVESLSIYANKLVEKSKEVLHGMIREVSLVIAGANPGAKIDFVAIQHADGQIEEIEDEAVIFTGLAIAHSVTGGDASDDDASASHADSTTPPVDETMQDIFDTLNPKQKDLVFYMLEQAVAPDATATHSDDASVEETVEPPADAATQNTTEVPASTDTNDSSDATTGAADNSGDATDGDAGQTAEHGDTNEDTLTHQEGTTMTNVFEQQADASAHKRRVLSHADLTSILQDARKNGSFKEAVLMHAERVNAKALEHADTNGVAGTDYGIEGIEMLFPDAKALMSSPDFISRRMEWVSVVLNGTKHSPFAKVKSVFADITADEARAKGYVKGTRKVEEVFKLLQRTTGPATIYKKQKLDRDDILDIKDMDVVMFLKGEMRLMIEEELARAILVGDGRSAMSADKVKDPEGATDGVGIRSILHDDDLYVIRRQLAANVAPKDAVKGLVRARTKYRGSGKPTLFISDAELTEMMLEEDKFGRALYETEQALADKLRVKEIVTVDIFDEYDGLFAIMVSLQDYTVGTNAGGELTSFEDFDIDFNQNKYLQETRLSGGLTKPFSAIVVTRAQGQLATATQPSYDVASKTITIPTSTGVIYTINDEPVTGDVVISAPTEVDAEPDSGYYLATGETRSWTFQP